MKRLISLFIVFAFSGFFGFGCSSLTENLLKDPEVNIVDFKLTGLSTTDVSMDLNLNVKNPNPIPLKLDAVTYALNFSGEKVTEGTFDKGISVPASGESQVTVPLKFKFNSVGNLLSGLINKSLSRQYELTGSAKLGMFSIPFEKKGEVNLNK